MDKCGIWIADEMDMTPLQVRYSWVKFLPQTQSGTPSAIIYGTPSAIIYIRWRIWHEGLGCHAPMLVNTLSGPQPEWLAREMCIAH